MKYAVLLGAVNVGKRTVKSDALKIAFEKGGFENPQTVLATGNVVIQSAKKPEILTLEIEQLLTQELSFEIKVKVISFEQLKAIVSAYPFQNVGTEFHKYIIFRSEKTSLDFSTLNLDTQVERLVQVEDIIYWQVLKGMTLESSFAKYLARISRKEFTTNRNMNTLEKILAKA